MPSARNVRRTPLLFACWAVAVGWALPSLAASDGFRGFAWGASQAEVRKGEKLPMHHDIEGEISYWNFKLAGVPAGIIYTFENERLTRAYYLSRHRTPDPEEDYDDYHAFQRHFDQELGPHVEEEWVWADGVEPGEENLEAVTSGRATLVTRWRTEGAQVKMEMTGKDGGIQTLRVYFEPE